MLNNGTFGGFCIDITRTAQLLSLVNRWLSCHFACVNCVCAVQIETAAVHLIVKNSGKEGYPLEGPTNLLLELQKLNVMDYKQLNICQTLRYLRNKAVHIQDEDFTKEATVQYIESALSIASFLEEKTD